MITPVGRYNIQKGTRPVDVTCPVCGRHGSFESINNKDIGIGGDFCVSHRQCPHPSCLAYVLVIMDNRSTSASAEVIECYPPQRIDFDASGVPSGIVNSFEEAITCHSNSCYVASAIMVRRTLEEICEEEGAEGGNLKARIKDLRDQVTLPKKLFEGMQDLRLLGNDAAHIEAWTYQNIGEEELEVAITFTKELLKAVYQYEELIGELKSLKASNNG